MKMVISIMGMTICLLCGCQQDKNEEKGQWKQETSQENAGSEDAGLEELEAWRATEQQKSKEEPETEASENNGRADMAEPETWANTHKGKMEGNLHNLNGLLLYLQN